MTSTTQGEHRMLIDGKLVDAKSGKTFDNINPATEEVLGPVADAGHDDMDEAIGAARRAFDETTWATDKAFRQRCIRQLQAALEEERELLRAELVAEVGAPIARPTDPSSTLHWPRGCCGRPSTSTSSPGSGTCRRARRSARAAGVGWPRKRSASSGPSSRGTTPSR